MKSKILPFIVGLLLGAALAIAGMLATSKSAEAAAGEKPGSEARQVLETVSKESLAAAEKEVNRLEAENAKLATKVQDLLKRAPDLSNPKSAEEESPFAALGKMLGGDGATNKMGEVMGGMMESMIESQIEAKMSALKSRLDLTPEQEAAVREILTRQLGAGMEAGKKMLAGKLSRDEMKQLGEQASNPRAEIQELLSPEQWQAYQQYEKEEQQQQARLLANAELLQLQQQFGLDEAQQDKVFAVLAEQALAQLDPEQQTKVPQNGDVAGMMRRQFENKQQALKDVLSPEQLDRYRKFNEQQIKFMEAFLPKDNNAEATTLKIPEIVPPPVPTEP